MRFLKLMEKWGKALIALAWSLALTACASLGSGAVFAAPELRLEPPLLWESARAERGRLVAAVPLAAESAETAVGLLKPELMALQMDVGPLRGAGFFEELARVKPGLRPVHPVRVRYWTADASGRPVQSGGLVYLPDQLEAPKALLIICHGTQILRDRVPSRLAGAERLVGQVAAATGMVVAMPDYPGMGDGEGFHPYCHGVSLGHDGTDLLRAARSLMVRNWPGAGGKGYRVYVSGYSEGGYAAMAVLKELVEQSPGEFPVAAAFPMAGPFDMAGTMRGVLLGDKPLPQPFYLPYLVFGWQLPEGETLQAGRFLDAAAYAGLGAYFDGRTAGSQVNARIEALQGVGQGQAKAIKLLSPEAVQALRDPSSSTWGGALAAMLAANSLYDWACPPSIPVYLMASPQDEAVPWENSLEAQEHMRGRGGQVQLITLGQGSHEQAGSEAYARMLAMIWRDLAAP